MPIEKDISVHGIWDATRRAHARFLLKAVNAIRSRFGREREGFYRNIARSNGLEIPLERAILNHDILVGSSLIGLVIPLTSFRDLLLKFANSLRDVLCSLV